MSNVYELQTEKLKEAINSHVTNYGARLCKGIDEASEILLSWLDYLRTSETTGVADLLLDGVQAAVIEAAGCLASGFVRPALLSFRAQVDMLLAWLYFRDHKVEWELVEDSGEGYKLKTELIRYLEEYKSLFKQRFGLLRQAKTRKHEDPYRFLSAFIHSQSSACVPAIDSLDKLVSPLSDCDECVKMQNEVTEYLNDILLAAFADKWASLPECTIAQLKTRLNQKQLASFFPSK